MTGVQAASDGRRSPYAPTPILVRGSAVLVVAVAAAAAAFGAWALAVGLTLTGAAPLRRGTRWLQWGSVLAYGSFGWELLALAPVSCLSGQWGGPRWIFALALGASALRIMALRHESTIRWAGRDWSLPAAPPGPVANALEAALRSPPETRDALVDAAVASLAAADPAEVPMQPDSRRAFWINAYNVLSLHSSRGRRSKRPLAAVEAMRTTYCIAGRFLSLEDIEHGLLRDNARPPGGWRRRLRPYDPRRAWSVPLDARIHFALNCGARSCPPVRVYRADALDAQLDLAERAFVEGETTIDPTLGLVCTSRIFLWYARDFGGRRAVLARIARVLGADEEQVTAMRLRFRRYDWTPTH